MKVKELLNRLNSIVKANPKNGELDVKYVTGTGTVLGTNDDTVARIACSNTTGNMAVYINANNLSDVVFNYLPDDGYPTPEVLYKFGEYVAKKYLPDVSIETLDNFRKCSNTSEMDKVFEASLERAFDTCEKEIHKTFKEPYNDLHKILIYLGARFYMVDNLGKSILDIIKETE